MIDTNSFKGLLDKYGMDADSVIKNNSKVLIRGNYSDIEATINYLVNDLGFASRYIEKAPSILYFNVSAIRKNVEFLKRQVIIFSKVEKCLHVLSTIPWRLEETYNYVRDNYGDDYLTNLIVIKGSKGLSRTLPYLDELGVLETVKKSASILTLTVDEIKERKKFIDSIGETMVLENGRFNVVFGMSKNAYARRVAALSKNNSLYGGK